MNGLRSPSANGTQRAPAAGNLAGQRAEARNAGGHPGPGLRVVRRWLVLAFAFTLPTWGPLHAAGTVTGGTLANLYAALLGGGHVTFSLSSATNFNLVAPLEIQSDTFLDAGTSAYAVTFSGTNGVRLFNIHPGVRLQLAKVSLSNGTSTNGGAVYNDGGTLIATNCTFSNNAAVGGAGAAGTAGQNDINAGRTGGTGGAGGPALGGAIWSSGEVQLSACTLNSNLAYGGDGGDGGAGGQGAILGGNGGDAGSAGPGLGGAIYCTGRLVLDRCTLQGNATTGGNGGTGGGGGAGSSLYTPASGRSAAGADSAGGAVYNLGDAIVTGCSFVTNTVTGGKAAGEFANAVGMGRDGHAGGAAQGGALFNGGTLQCVNSTFSVNAVTGGAGGAGGNSPSYFGGRGGDGGAALGGGLWSQNQAAVTNCTFAAGYATGGQGGAAGTSGDAIEPGSPRPGSTGRSGGGNLASGGGSFVLLNCIVAYAGAGGNGVGTFTDAGHNLSSDATCGFGAPGSLNQTDPLLGPLGAYGGSTQTIPLLAGSPAIDAGAPVAGLTQDQRGYARPLGTAYDLGAFERVFAGLSGHVTRADGSGFPGVTVSLLSVTSLPLTTTTDANGRFEFVLLPDVDLGVYRIAPPTAGPGFSPAFRDVQLTTASPAVTNLDFVALGDRLVGLGFTTGGAFQLRYLGLPGQACRCQSTDAFARWQDIAGGTTDTNGMLDFLDAGAAASRFRFYRVVTP